MSAMSSTAGISCPRLSMRSSSERAALGGEFVSTGELLYTVATDAIVHNTTTGRQSFFTKHSEEIVAVTVDKEGQLVATADNSPSSTIYVWSSITLEAKMRLAINPAGCVVGMCFSSDASKLVVVSEVKDASIEVFDW